MMKPMEPAVAEMARTNSCQWRPILVETAKPALTPTLCTSLTSANASALFWVYWLLTRDITLMVLWDNHPMFGLCIVHLGIEGGVAESHE